MQCANCGTGIGPTDVSCRGCGRVIGAGAGQFREQSAVGQTNPSPVFAPSNQFQAEVPTGHHPAKDPWAVPAPGETWSVPGAEVVPSQQPPAQPYRGSAVPVARSRQSGNGNSIAAMVFGAISFVFCPLVVGIIALLLAARAWSRGEPMANIAVGVSLAGMIGGMIIGVVVYSMLQPSL